MMEAKNIRDMLRRLALAGTLSILAILAGCSDNTTGPAPTDETAPGSNATILVSDPVPAQEADEVRANVRRNESDTLIISIEEAIAIALQQSGGGDLLGVTLDYDSDDLNYECVVRQGAVVYVVVVDPQTGSVKKKEAISNYYFTHVIIIRPIVVKVKDAKERARKFAQGDVVECNLENVDGQLTYIVVIITAENRYVTIYIDADSGKERKLKDDGRCDDDKHRNKKGRGHYRHGHGKGYGHYHHCHCDCDNDGDTTQVPAGIISVDSVRTIASATIDSIRIDEVKLKVENDTTASYEVKASRDSNHYEITYDAFTGSFISIKQTGGDMTAGEFQPQVPGDTLVALSVARTAALAQVAGNVTMWTLEYDETDAMWVYTIEVEPAAGGERKQVLVDASTGLFIRIK